jgi:hypothetical protein
LWLPTPSRNRVILALAGFIASREEYEMYTFFYPETGERFSSAKELEFETPEAAIEYWKDKRPTWNEIKPMNPSDKAAFMLLSNGHIVVVRQLTNRS